MENKQEVYNNNPYVDSKKKWSLAKIFGTVLFALMITFTLAVVSFQLIYDYHPVEGESMRPTLNNYADDKTEDCVFVNRLNSGRVGDIIVIKRPSVMVVKRFVADGGDKIAVVQSGDEYIVQIIKKGKNLPIVFDYTDINGGATSVLYNDFYTKNDGGNKVWEIINGTKYLVIPDNCVFYLGDNMNPSKSEDCADYGPVLKETVVGKVDYIIYGGTNIIGQIIDQMIFNKARKP